VSVLLPNATLGVRRRLDAGRDAHGAPKPGGWGAVTGPHPGLAEENPDALWVLGLDPVLWPVRQGDMVIDTVTGAAWLIDTADLLTHPVDPTVNWIRTTGRQRSAGGTEPGGPWFVARYVPDAPPPVTEAAGMWTGDGPPSLAALPDAKPGDEYIDMLTGVVYRLEG
jgi:hypothetical protein